MVEGAALEKQYAGNGIEGSNPSLSAINTMATKFVTFKFSTLAT